MENVPIQNYTNWQLIRFEEKGINKIASSRFNRNTIIDDDIIFKKVSKKEKEICNEIKLNNYEEVKNVILSDISFLKKVGSYTFSLLLMYYQYEGNEKHEKYVKNGVIKIRNSLDNKPEMKLSREHSRYKWFDEKSIKEKQGKCISDAFHYIQKYYD